MKTAPVALREDHVVAAIRAIVEPVANRRILVGIGDDAALWQPSRSHCSAIATDMFVEGVHFTRSSMRFSDAGWRAMMANASDLAAMGARPVLATVALGVPEGAGVDDVRDLYTGMMEAARSVRLDIVGGDLSRAPALTVGIAIVGEVRASNVKTRSGARAGAVIAVTGSLGAARAGFEAAEQAGLLHGELEVAALRAFRRPLARCAEGRFFGASVNVQAMMDISDGLSTDLDRLCAASGCGATLDDVPVNAAAQALAEQRGEDPQHYALAGGEDFELLVAIAPRAFAHLAKRFAVRFGRPLHPVGHLRAQAGIDFRNEALPRSGWDHFAR